MIDLIWRTALVCSLTGFITMVVLFLADRHLQPAAELLFTSTPIKTAEGCSESKRVSSQQSEHFHDRAIMSRAANPKLKATMACTHGCDQTRIRRNLSFQTRFSGAILIRSLL
jgi:hypothetical protein